MFHICFFSHTVTVAQHIDKSVDYNFTYIFCLIRLAPSELFCAFRYLPTHLNFFLFSTKIKKFFVELSLRVNEFRNRYQFSFCHRCSWYYQGIYAHNHVQGRSKRVLFSNSQTYTNICVVMKNIEKFLSDDMRFIFLFYLHVITVASDIELGSISYVNKCFNILSLRFFILIHDIFTPFTSCELSRFIVFTHSFKFLNFIHKKLCRLLNSPTIMQPTPVPAITYFSRCLILY